MVSVLRAVGFTAACIIASASGTTLRGLEAATPAPTNKTCPDADETKTPSTTTPAPTPSPSTRNSYGFIAAEAPDYNNGVVTELLANVSNIRDKGEAYATFDFDNTCIYGDISYTSVFYQVDNLDFRFSPDDFETIFALGYTEANGDACLPNGTNTILGSDVNGNGVTLAHALESTAADYRVLYDAYIGPTYGLTSGNASATLEEIKKTTEYLNFRAKISFLTFGLEGVSPDERSECAMHIAMSIFPQMLVGMTEAEIKTMITSSLRWNLNAKLDTLSYTSTGDLEVEGEYTAGLRVFNGQETTMRALRAAEVDVYIISASPQVFVDVVGSLLGLTYWVPSSNIYAVRFTFDDDAKFTGKLIEDYPITWGPGKATIVEEYLKPLYNNQYPIYASGDSDGDCDFLDTVRDGIVHVNNRLKSSSTCIHGFYDKSCTYFGTTEPSTNNKYLLQGQDRVIGSWIPSGFTTSDGVTYAAGATDTCTSYKFL